MAIVGVEDDNNAKFLFIGSLSKHLILKLYNFSDLLFELEPNAKIIIGGTGPCERNTFNDENKKNVIMLGWVKGK